MILNTQFNSENYQLSATVSAKKLQNRVPSNANK